MKIVNLTGGLGNQLFQYSFGQNLQKETNTKVKYDTRWFETDMDYEHDLLYLDFFETEYETANISDINNTLPLDKNIIEKVYNISPKLSKDLFNYFKDTPRGDSLIFISGPHKFEYSSKVVSMDTDAYFDGHWQAFQYVENSSEILNKELNLAAPLSKQSKSVKNKIDKSESISIHIRRGDYTKQNAHLPLDYYKKCIKKLNKITFKPKYYIFSDDIYWVKENLEIRTDHTYVDHNEAETAYEDLALMSSCSHNIIANSTFSWWGAWLNQNSSKIVIAPDTWLGWDTDNIDILPKSWRKCHVSKKQPHSRRDA